MGVSTRYGWNYKELGQKILEYYKTDFQNIIILYPKPSYLNNFLISSFLSTDVMMGKHLQHTSVASSNYVENVSNTSWIYKLLKLKNFNRRYVIFERRYIILNCWTRNTNFRALLLFIHRIKIWDSMLLFPVKYQ